MFQDVCEKVAPQVSAEQTKGRGIIVSIDSTIGQKILKSLKHMPLDFEVVQTADQAMQRCKKDTRLVVVDWVRFGTQGSEYLKRFRDMGIVTADISCSH